MNMNEQQTKTLEQIAFEAQAGPQQIQWEDLYPINKRLWKATASAVEQAVLQRLGVEWKRVPEKKPSNRSDGDMLVLWTNSADSAQPVSLQWLSDISEYATHYIPVKSLGRPKPSSSPTSEPESLPPGFIEAVQAKSGFTDPFEVAPEVHVATEGTEWKPKFKQGDIVKKPGHGEATGEVGFVCWDERTVQVRWVNPTGGFTHTTTERNQDALELVSSRESPFLTPDELRALCGGQEPHRLDGWRREWLTDRWRPLLYREQIQVGDQYFSTENDWRIHSGSDVLGFAIQSTRHQRTRRPLPQPPATPAQSEVDILADLPLHRVLVNDPQDVVRYMHETANQITTLTKELASANEQATLSANHAKHYEQRMNETLEMMVIHSKNYESHKEHLMAEIKVWEMRTAGERARVAELARERDDLLESIKSQDDTYAALKSRAEAAEKKLAEVEKVRDAHFARCQELARECIEKDKQLSRLTWTPISTRLPTKEDSDDCGEAWWRTKHGNITNANYALDPGYVRDQGYTHWMTPIPLPTPPEEDAFTKFWNTEGKGIWPHDITSARRCFLAGQQSK